VIKDSFPDSDKELLTVVVKRYKEQDTWCLDPIMKKEALGLLQEVMKTAGELKQEASYEDIVDNSYAKKAMEKMNKK
jgi:NitT/TauT family transport system substrate-binding protein